MAVPRSENDLAEKPTGKQQIVLTKAPETALIQPPLLLTLALAGRHQQENAVAALATLDKISNRYPGLDVNAALKGLANVEWPGRLQILTSGADRPTLLVDCAHNVDSAAIVVFGR